MRLGQEARAKLLEDYKRLPRSLEPISREWEKWLKGGQPTVAVTFEQATAADNPNATHLSVMHPLVRQAARFLQLDEPMYASLAVRGTEIPFGDYPFAVFRWKKHGVKLDEVLVPVVSPPEIENALLTILQSATDTQESMLPSEASIERLDAQHHAKWIAAQASHIAENRQQVEHRIQSLTVSHQHGAAQLNPRLLAQ